MGGGRKVNIHRHIDISFPNNHGKEDFCPTEPAVKSLKKKAIDEGSRGKEKVPISRNLGSPSTKILLVCFTKEGRFF